MDAFEIECDERAGDCGDLPSVIDREEPLGKNACVDRPIDVAERNASHHRGCRRLEAIDSEHHGSVP
ncbi:MAG: hypothetical protein M0038_14360 [Pseudomonadota bacterium]|nr:hypothetical protein [Pseudomonadota bacterium]